MFLFSFQYIENLDRMKRLQVLILSNNIIEKIEKLDKLLKLKELNLSMNCITKIEGLENLTNLQLLNLTGNLIEHIPIWIGKRLKSLRAFHIGRNKLESVGIQNLTIMGDLWKTNLMIYHLMMNIEFFEVHCNIEIS